MLFRSHGISHLQQEVNEVFFNPYTQFIPVTASYYLEDRDDGKKRLQMVEYLLSSKFRKDSENFHELEDHIGFIMLFMQKLLEANIEGDEKSSQISNDVFTNILNPFIDQFIFTLHEHPNSDFFKEIAILLRSFVAFERAFLNVAPTQEVVVDKDYTIRPKKRKPLTPRPKKNFEEMSLKDTY